MVLAEQGRLDEAIQHLRDAVSLSDDWVSVTPNWPMRGSPLWL